MASEQWTVRSLIAWSEGYLGDRDDENPRLSAELLLADALGLSRVELYLDMDRPLEAAELDVYRGHVSRRGKGEPIQYITGKAPFRHIQLHVRKGVLIPRPETEVLVSEALSRLPEAAAREVSWSAEAKALEDAAVAEVKAHIAELQTREASLAKSDGDQGSDQGSDQDGESHPVASAADDPEPASPDALIAVDLGTGSGAIACSLAYERDDVRVIATDISQTAVDLARENAASLELSDKVKVILCDMGEGIPSRYLGSIGLVVSNPPYIPTALLAELPREVVDFEPDLALDGGEDGNDFARRILDWALGALKPGGACCLELHEDAVESAADYARSRGYGDVRVVADLAGRPRVLSAVKTR